MRIPQNRATARSGVNVLRTLLEAQNHVFQEVEQHNDFGIDGYVELSVAGQPTGLVVAVQVKSGASYLAAAGYCGDVRGDPEHVDYWMRHVLPVALVVHDPKAGRTWWCDVKASVAAAGRETGESLRLVVDRPFEAATLDDFAAHFAGSAPNHASDAQFFRVIEMLADPRDESDFYEACWALFQNNRDRYAAWHWLILIATSTSTPTSRKRVIFRVLFFLAHNPDTYWTERNIVPNAVAKRARAMLARALGRDEVVELLSMVDENGFERGTLGQAVRCLLDLLPLKDQGRHFWWFAFDEATPEEPRYAALCLLLDYIDQNSDSPQDELQTVVGRYLQQFPEAAHRPVLTQIAWIIDETGHAPVL